MAWWMMHYGAETPKRHLALSNDAFAERLDLGKLSKRDREKNTKKTTVIKYHSKSGRASYKGTSALKSTQFLCRAISYIYICIYICVLDTRHT